jgi:Pyocin activator protein PrtN.
MANAATMLYLKYDRVRLTVEEVAHELGIKPGTVRNQISEGSFPVPSYVEGRNRFIDVRALGQYLDERHTEALASLA